MGLTPSPPPQEPSFHKIMQQAGQRALQIKQERAYISSPKACAYCKSELEHDVLTCPNCAASEFILKEYKPPISLGPIWTY